MVNPFQTNPHKAAAKIEINNTLMAVCIAVFSILWAFAPERISVGILLQFICAVPLLYVSNIAYTKIAYWKDVKLWDYLGWFSANMAIAFVLNIIGILIFFLGYKILALVYFLIIWFLLTIYTIINIYYNRKNMKYKLFKLFFFIIIQLIFGVCIIFF